MKSPLIFLWASTCAISFYVGKNLVVSHLPDRAPSSIEKKREVIGQKVLVVLGQERKLNFMAKVDTGAESSSLHAENIKVHWIFENNRNVPYVSFRTVDEQKKFHDFFKRVSKIDDVKNANGKMIRYYIKEEISFQNKIVEIDISLTSRADMTFKFLLGKNALKSLDLLVDPDLDVIFYENSSPRYVYQKP